MHPLAGQVTSSLRATASIQTAPDWQASAHLRHITNKTFPAVITVLQRTMDINSKVGYMHHHSSGMHRVCWAPGPDYTKWGRHQVNGNESIYQYASFLCCFALLARFASLFRSFVGESVRREKGGKWVTEGNIIGHKDIVKVARELIVKCKRKKKERICIKRKMKELKDAVRREL